jgi:hypothetical protein
MESQLTFLELVAIGDILVEILYHLPTISDVACVKRVCKYLYITTSRRYKITISEVHNMIEFETIRQSRCVIMGETLEWIYDYHKDRYGNDIETLTKEHDRNGINHIIMNRANISERIFMKDGKILSYRLTYRGSERDFRITFQFSYIKNRLADTSYDFAPTIANCDRTKLDPLESRFLIPLKDTNLEEATELLGLRGLCIGDICERAEIRSPPCIRLILEEAHNHCLNN